MRRHAMCPRETQCSLLAMLIITKGSITQPWATNCP